MASPELPSAKRISAPDPSPLLWHLSDDLLAEIFLRLPTLADVGRAANACASFRRVVAERTFLRRLHSVHPEPLLGLLLFSSIQPAEPPHPSTPFARALLRAADLSFSFIPSAGRWTPIDARDGRVLLEREAMGGDFAVCDPLSRRYLFLPHMPGYPDPAAQCRRRMEPFLVPASDDEARTSFRVFSVVEGKPGHLVGFVFSSATGQWRSLAVDASVQTSCKFFWSSYACGCLYWKATGTNNFLVLDTRSMEFSSVDVPYGHSQQDSVIVEAAEGRIGMFTLQNSIISAASYLVYNSREINEGNSMWQVKRRVRLPSQYIFSFADAVDRHLLIRGIPWNLPLGFCTDEVGIGYFSVEFKSMRIEKMCELRHLLYAKLYTGFPPSLCLPSI